MPKPPRSLLLILSAACGLSQAPPPASGQNTPVSLVTSRNDPRLAELRRAAALWDLRSGPTREVVDQVCLVPDVATFFEALAAWDESHYFPILIDDVDLDLKFLRAFRPARVVRYPGRGKPIEPGQVWERAVLAVGDAWSNNDIPASDRLKGDERPERLGKTPPGVVLGRPESSMLPGLAALAAGRFQPLVRVDSTRQFNDMLAGADVEPFFNAIDSAVVAKVPGSGRLGDDCDFLTLAGDYPYRYAASKGMLAVDDRAGRAAYGRRWAYAGRLLGDARQGVYAAMCSLFLRPESAALFDGYSETDVPWKYWGLRPAAARIDPLVRTVLAAGARATLQGWHELFKSTNRYGLVMINSHGSPRVFNIPAGPAHSLDIMPSVPAAVSMIHSYSAADPLNRGTIAGRWLDQGAFLYAGAMDEPYLNSFRLPVLVADLLFFGYPFAAAVRPMPFEPYGEPWKLVVLGDPLYVPLPRKPAVTRTRAFPATPAWVPYAATNPPAPDAHESTRLAWAVNASLFGATNNAPDTSASVIAVLRTIDRLRLDSPLRGVYDELQAVLLYQTLRFEELRAAVAAVPRDERSPVAARLALSAALVEFQQSIARKDFERAATLWSYMIHADRDVEFLKLLTGRIFAYADTPSRRDAWRRRVRDTLADLDSPDARAVLAAELKRVEASIASDRAAPGR